MNIKNKLMLFCMGVLVLALVTIGVRLVARQVLVKKLNIDNALTQIILFDKPNLQKNIPIVKEKIIDWAKIYPFTDEENSKQTADKNKFTFTKSEESALQKDIVRWSTDNFMMYDYWVECGYDFKRLIDFSILPTGNEKVQQLNDGYYVYTYNRHDMTEYAASIARLDDFAKENGAKFCYVNIVRKKNKFADTELNGIDYTNDNADELLEKLKARGIDTLDFREYTKNLSPSEYHALFYRTDHHWRASTAILAAGIIIDKLESLGITVDKSHFNVNDYEEKLYPKAYLGSQGSKLKLSRNLYDDISLYYPKFPTNVHIEVPSFEINENSDFSVLYNRQQVKEADLTGKLDYHVYMYSDNPLTKVDNFNINSSQKVLVIRDSFTDTMGPFLAMGLAHVTFLDIRAFTGSVQTFIKELQPDVIIVAYSSMVGGGINWNNHRDLFDFR